MTLEDNARTLVIWATESTLQASLGKYTTEYTIWATESTLQASLGKYTVCTWYTNV